MPKFTAAGVNPLGADFPFVSPSADVSGVLSDFWLAHEVHGVVLPLRISWMYGFDAAFAASSSSASAGSVDSSASSSSGEIIPTHAVDLIVVDAEDRVVFDSTAAEYFRSTDFGYQFRIHEWRVGNDAVCRAVQYVGFNESRPEREIAQTIEPINGVLDERTHELLPRRVTSLQVGLQNIRGAVNLRNGFNTTLTAGSTATSVRPRVNVVIPRVSFGTVGGGRRKSQVVLSAEPGEGLGRFPGCDQPSLVLRTLNGIGPRPSGDFMLAASGCYWVRQPMTVAFGTARPTPATIQIGNDCGPCCECADYENVYRGIINVHGKFKDIGRRAEATRDQFDANIARWMADKACRAETAVRIALATAGEYLDVAIAICNSNDACLTDIQLAITLETLTGFCNAAVPVSCTTTISVSNSSQRQDYHLAGAWPNYYAYWDSIDPGRSVDVRTRLRMLNCADVPASIKVCAQATSQGRPMPIGGADEFVCQVKSILGDC